MIIKLLAFSYLLYIVSFYIIVGLCNSTIYRNYYLKREVSLSNNRNKFYTGDCLNCQNHFLEFLIKVD